jgi:CheY-like chemotaxis protein
MNSGAKHAILLVENDADSCTALVQLLVSHGHTVECAATVAEALALLDNEPTHVILDMMLPDGTGLVILQYIRATAPWTQVAILSGWVHPVVAGSVQPDLVLAARTDVHRLLDWLREAYETTIGAPRG